MYIFDRTIIKQKNSITTKYNLFCEIPLEDARIIIIFDKFVQIIKHIIILFYIF